MPIYEFTCEKGHKSSWRMTIEQYTEFKSYMIYCEYGRTNCGALLKRRFSFAIKSTMPDHYNQSAGTYVSSERNLQDVFKRQSEAATIRTGIPHEFVPVDPRDKDKLGVTDEGLAATYDRRKKLGMKIPSVVRPENMT